MFGLGYCQCSLLRFQFCSYLGSIQAIKIEDEGKFIWSLNQQALPIIFSWAFF
jgi:hypothetical protein